MDSTGAEISAGVLASQSAGVLASQSKADRVSASGDNVRTSS
jgi:hypothetical protein